MPISIPISASPTGAVDAIKAIQDAIQRAGQAGRQFAQLDLSHPELSAMAEDIRRLAGRFHDLSRIGRGETAAAFRGVNRAGGGGDPADFLAWESNLSRVFPDPAQRAQHRARVLNYATAGTQWQQQAPAPIAPPPAPAAAGGGGAAAATGGGGGGGLMGGVGGLSLMGFVGPALALAGIATVKGVLSESIGKAQEEAGTTEDIYRHTDTTKTFLDLRDAVMASTKALGVNAQEAGRLSLMWTKMTGETDPETINARIRMGVGMGRSFGMDPSTATSGLAQATVLGLAPRDFAVLVGEAAGKGGRSADETMPALLRLAEASTRALVTHSNLVESASMLAGLNAMGEPGLRGAGGEAIINQLGNSLTAPGAGAAGQAFLYMAGQRQQGITDPYRQRYLREGGLFASPADEGIGSSSVTNFEAIRSEIKRQFPGDSLDEGLHRADAMANLTGLNMRQVMALERFKPADMNTTALALKHAGVGLEKLDETAIGDAVRIANAPLDDKVTDIDPTSAQPTTQVGLNTLRQQMLGRHGQGALSSEDQASLTAAGPTELRDVMLQMEAKYGQAETDGSKTRESQALLSNAMTKVGQDLLPAFNDLKSGLGTLGGELADLGSVITNVYRAAKGDPEASDQLMFGKAGRRVAGGNEAPLTSAGQSEAAAKLLAFYQTPEGGSYTRDQAAGIAAQAGAESGYRAHGPAGDGGLAQGMFQWHPDRVAAIEGQFHKRLADMSFQEQAAAKAWELSPQGPEAAAGQALRATTTAYGAGYAETVNDQRPAGAPMRGVGRGTLAMSIASAPPPAPTATFAPLQVIHLDQYGNILGTHELPVTTINPPAPVGMTAPGQTPKPPPPPPPPPRFNTGQQFWGGAP